MTRDTGDVMALNLLENPVLMERCNEAASEWARHKPSSLTLWRAAQGYTTMVRRAILANPAIPQKPTEAQARHGLTEAHAQELRDLLFANPDVFLSEVADEMIRLAPVRSFDAAEKLNL